MNRFRHDDHPRDFLDPTRHSWFRGPWLTIHVAEILAAVGAVILVVVSIFRAIAH